MFKNILIISDKLHVCQGFDRIIAGGNFQGVNWSFAISPFSDIDTFQKNMDHSVMVYDMKDAATIQLLVESYDLIFSMHCKQFFPARLVNAVKCINIHPGYNPLNRGWYPQVFAIMNDVPAGATIHIMDDQLDHGAIIDRAFVEKKIYDTSLSLYDKIVDKELELLQKNLPDIIHDRETTFPPEKEGKLFLKKDFNNLLHFDLDKKMTGLEFINYLRALNHGDYKNAWFTDPDSGKKIFLQLSLEPDEA